MTIKSGGTYHEGSIEELNEKFVGKDLLTSVEF